MARVALTVCRCSFVRKTPPPVCLPVVIKASVTGGVAVNAPGFDLRSTHAAVRLFKIRNATECRTVCPYCAVGCETIAYVHSSGGLNTKNTVIHVEGDPDSPINRGSLRPKGASQMEFAISPRLRHHPLLRRAGAADWGEVEWDTAMDWFARRSRTRATPPSASAIAVAPPVSRGTPDCVWRL